MNPPKLSLKINATQAIAWVALFVSLGGTVYAAAKINGKTIKKGSIPANRIKADSLTGAQVNEASLGNVPSASRAAEAQRAASADTAGKARQAETAVRALQATEAGTADFAVAADRARMVASAARAADARALDGVAASGYLGLCAKGTALALVKVTPAGLNPAATGFNCGDPGNIGVDIVRRPDGTIIVGEFRISLGTTGCPRVVGSTQGVNSVVRASSLAPGGPTVCSAGVFSTRTNAPLPDEPFTLVVF